MKNSNFETLVKPVIVLVVICIITSAALAFTNSVTAPIIEEQEIAAANAAYQAVLPEADSFTAVAFDTENVVDAVKADNGAGYCIKANGKGYGGAVPVVVGFDADGKIVGVQFMQNSESAGFGMKLWDGNAEGVANEAVSHDASCGKLTILRDWLDNSNVIRVRGNCSGASGERMNMFRSEQFFVTVMCEKLAARGVSVGNVVYAASPDTFALLHRTQRSILDVVDEALKESNNLCAEALTFHLGALYGHRPVAHKDGAQLIKGYLDYNLKIPGKYEIADGSGLSLYTYISADIMLQMLRRIYGNRAVYEAVLRGLPVAGWTGTLKGRMAGTVAERKIHAKTGTVSGICTLAGYATARNGHTFAFVIFNQGIMTPRLARRWQNKVCELMCR